MLPRHNYIDGTDTAPATDTAAIEWLAKNVLRALARTRTRL